VATCKKPAKKAPNKKSRASERRNSARQSNTSSQRCEKKTVRSSLVQGPVGTGFGLAVYLSSCNRPSWPFAGGRCVFAGPPLQKYCTMCTKNLREGLSFRMVQVIAHAFQRQSQTVSRAPKRNLSQTPPSSPDPTTSDSRTEYND